MVPRPYMSAWRSLSSIGKLRICTLASVAHSVCFSYRCLWLSHEGNFHYGRLAALLRDSIPRGRGVPKWRVRGQQGFRAFLEASSNWHRCMERCHWFVSGARCEGILSLHRGVTFQEHHGPWERSCRGMGLIENRGRNCKCMVGTRCLQCP